MRFYADKFQRNVLMTMSDSVAPLVELVGVYRQSVEIEIEKYLSELKVTLVNWEPSSSDIDSLTQSLKNRNEPMVLLELHLKGVTFWSSWDTEPDFESIGKRFDPFTIRQQHTVAEDTHWCDCVFLNRDGTSWYHGSNEGLNCFQLNGANDFRILICLRRFRDQEPILTPFRSIDAYTVTEVPERLNGLSGCVLCGID